MIELSRQNGAPICGKDFKTGQTLLKTVLAPAFKARMLGVAGWYSTNILGNRDGESPRRPRVLQDQGGIELGVLDYILQPDKYPDLTATSTTRSVSTITRPAATTKKAGTNIDIFGWLGYPMQIKSTFSAATPSSRAHRPRPGPVPGPGPAHARNSATSAFRSGSASSLRPQSAPGLYPEHDLFIQSMKLKNTLRHIMGEDLITHLGLEYYD